MNKLSQECIEQIEKFTNMQGNLNRRYGYWLGATKALTNPTIYQSAGLMTVEEALRFGEWIADNYLWIPLKKKFVHEDDYDAIELFETTELLTIFREQIKKK
jgi:hypothetical protein